MSRWEPTPPEQVETTRPPRWGFRLLGFLALAAVALITAMAQGHHTIGTFSCTIIGFVGAGWCTVRGMGVMGGVMDALQGRKR